MTITQIKNFFVVAASKTYSEAAERLHSSPSVLFKSIKGLEDELGVHLFTKDKSHLQLTEQGDWIYPHLQYIVAQYSTMERVASNFRVTLHPKSLDIGCMFFSDEYKLLELTNEVQELSPALKIRLSEYRAGEINEQLHNYSLAAAFIYRELLQDSYPHLLNIKKEPLVALMNRTMAKKFAAPLYLSALAGNTFILMHGDQLLHHYLQRICINAGFIPNELPMDLRVESMGAMLANNGFVTVIMESFARKMCEKNDLVILPVRDAAPLTLCLVATEHFPSSGYLELESYLQAGFSAFGTLLPEDA